MWSGLASPGWKDWELKKVLLDEDWVLVTWNCKDFRGPKDAPGLKGVLADVPLHAGLVCINGQPGWIWIFSDFFLRSSSKNLTSSQTSQIKSWKSPSMSQVSVWTLSDLTCEFNRSMQHLLAVYWQGSGTLKFFVVVG